MDTADVTWDIHRMKWQDVKKKRNEQMNIANKKIHVQSLKKLLGHSFREPF